MTPGDAALEQQPLTHLPAEPKTEQVTGQVLIASVVDRPSHVA
jgi:hypothetical protein